MDSRMEVWQQCCSSMLLGSTIWKTNLKAFRISIVLADTSLSNDPAHYLHLSTCMFLPCMWTLDCMAGQVCYCSSVVAQDFGWASSDVAQEFGWAAVCQPQSSKTPITDEMIMKMDPTTGTLFFFSFWTAGMWEEDSHLENPIILILEQPEYNSMQRNPSLSHIKGAWVTLKHILAPVWQSPIQ